MKIKLIPALLSALLTVSSLAGCSNNTTDDPAVGTSSVTTAASGSADESTAPSDSGTEADSTNNGNETVNANEQDPEKEAQEAQIKEIYTVSSEDAEWIAEEKTKNEIKYTGFDCKYFSTPALTDDLPLASATPLYSHSGLHNYVEKNSALFDLGDGEGSFSTTAERYMESFFEDKGVVVISFTDEAGGGNYTLTGAWDEHLEAGDVHLDQLVFALKKTPGENKTGHLIIEADIDFLSIWDSISVSIYE